eukprot:2173565-Lingulodinium_polyedra.AAC.1
MMSDDAIGPMVQGPVLADGGSDAGGAAGSIAMQREVVPDAGVGEPPVQTEGELRARVAALCRQSTA